MTRKKTISTLAAACAIAALALGQPAHAQQRRFDVPAQDARQAIPQFARQAGIQISAPTGRLRGVRTHAIKGNLDARAALRAMIAGTGLSIASDDGSMIILRYGEAQRPTSSVAPAEAAPETAEADPFADSEIIVTAGKRNERLLDVPFSITALKGDTLTRNGEVRLEDYAARVPGLNVTNNATGGAQSGVSIRGITTGSGNPTVAVYIDDTPVTTSTFFGGGNSIPDLDPNDLERIEVLRGPQGTLYGAASLGGLIKFVNKAPDFRNVGGRVEIGATAIDGGDVGVSARGRINLPLSETAAVTASGFHRVDPGFLDDPARGRKDRNRSLYDGGRVALALKPTETISVNLSALHQRIRIRGNPVIDVDPVTGRPIGGDLVSAPVPGTDRSNASLWLFDLAIKGDFDGFEVVSDTSYSRRRFSSVVDYSPVLGPLITQFFGVPGAGGGLVSQLGANKFTQEVRLTSSASGLLGWQVGAYYTRETSTLHQETSNLDGATGAVLPTVPLLLSVDGPTRYEEIAGFGNLTLNLSERFDVQAGLRYSHNSQRSQSITDGLLTGAGVIPASSSENQLTFSINPRFRISNTLMVYARVASGFRPGGPNAGLTGPFATYGADKVINYELGTKADLFDRMLSLDLAGFFIDWDDVQIRGTDPVTGLNFYRNGGKARSKGVEGSFALRPVAGLTINGNIAYTDAYTRSASAAPTFANPGDRLPNTPKWAGLLGAEYGFALAESWNGYVGANYRHVGSRLEIFTASAAIPRFVLPSYDTVDLRAGLSHQGYALDIYVRNVGDTRAFLSNSGTGAIQRIAIIQPRTFGVSLSKTF
jgi:outer membrane receptor protein involved in Fe transport